MNIHTYAKPHISMSLPKVSYSLPQPSFLILNPQRSTLPLAPSLTQSVPIIHYICVCIFIYIYHLWMCFKKLSSKTLTFKFRRHFRFFYYWTYLLH